MHFPNSPGICESKPCHSRTWWSQCCNHQSLWTLQWQWGEISIPPVCFKHLGGDSWSLLFACSDLAEKAQSNTIAKYNIEAEPELSWDLKQDLQNPFQPKLGLNPHIHITSQCNNPGQAFYVSACISLHQTSSAAPQVPHQGTDQAVLGMVTNRKCHSVLPRKNCSTQIPSIRTLSGPSNFSFPVLWNSGTYLNVKKSYQTVHDAGQAML